VHDRRLWIVSGPRASGKSTFVRSYWGYSKRIRLPGVPKNYTHCRILQWLLDHKNNAKHPHNIRNMDMIEYNIMKVYNHRIPDNLDDFGVCPYDSEIAWQYMINDERSRKRMAVLVFVLPLQELLRRVRTKYKGRQQVISNFLKYYTTNNLIKLYDKWIDELKRQRLPYRLLHFVPPYHKIDKITEILHE
jgi:hypothetical protein